MKFSIRKKRLFTSEKDPSAFSMKKILFILVTAVVVVTMATAPGCAGKKKPAALPEIVTIGISTSKNSIFGSAVFIAIENDYFLAEDIELKIRYYASGKETIAALFSGEVDIAAASELPIALNSFKRNDFTIWITIAMSAKNLQVLARKDRGVNNPQDLVGKKVAIAMGTIIHYFMDTYLLTNRIDTSDVEIVDVQPQAMVDAIVNGNVDAIFSWEPNIYYAQKILGDNAIVLPNLYGPRVTYNLVSKKDFIGNNPQSLRKTIKALQKAEEFMKDNRAESIDMTASRLEIDKKDLSELWDLFEFELSLLQTLLVALEEKARWAITNKVTDKTKVPNYLDFIYPDALRAVELEAVTIVW